MFLNNFPFFLTVRLIGVSERLPWDWLSVIYLIVIQGDYFRYSQISL